MDSGTLAALSRRFCARLDQTYQRIGVVSACIKLGDGSIWTDHKDRCAWWIGDGPAKLRDQCVGQVLVADGESPAKLLADSIIGQSLGVFTGIDSQGNVHRRSIAKFL